MSLGLFFTDSINGGLNVESLKFCHFHLIDSLDTVYGSVKDDRLAHENIVVKLLIYIFIVYPGDCLWILFLIKVSRLSYPSLIIVSVIATGLFGAFFLVCVCRCFQIGWLDFCGYSEIEQLLIEVVSWMGGLSFMMWGLTSIIFLKATLESIICSGWIFIHIRIVNGSNQPLSKRKYLNMVRRFLTVLKNILNWRHYRLKVCQRSMCISEKNFIIKFNQISHIKSQSI